MFFAELIVGSDFGPWPAPPETSKFIRALEFPKHVQRSKTHSFKCNDCGKAYMWKKTLLRHIRLECGGKEPQFPCPICNYRFKYMCHRRRHMVAIHGCTPLQAANLTRRHWLLLLFYLSWFCTCLCTGCGGLFVVFRKYIVVSASYMLIIFRSLGLRFCGAVVSPPLRLVLLPFFRAISDPTRVYFASLRCSFNEATRFCRKCVAWSWSRRSLRRRPRRWRPNRRRLLVICEQQRIAANAVSVPWLRKAVQLQRQLVAPYESGMRQRTAVEMCILLTEIHVQKPSIPPP